MRVAVILPTRNRIEQTRKCVYRLLETTQKNSVFCYIVTEDDRPAFYGLADMERVGIIATTEDMTSVQKWNVGYKRTKALSYDAWFLGADDLWWGDGWLDELLDAQAKANSGATGINDCNMDGAEFSTHWLATREFIEQQYGDKFVCPHYRSWYIDMDVAGVAKKMGAYAWADKSLVEHRHVVFNKAANDATYAVGARVQDYDEMIARWRCSRGWPVDWLAPI